MQMQPFSKNLGGLIKGLWVVLPERWANGEDVADSFFLQGRGAHSVRMCVLSA